MCARAVAPDRGAVRPAGPAGATEGGGPPSTVTGSALRAWVAALLARHHRVEARGYAVAGNQVTWAYRAFTDPYQQVTGVPPVEGAATATVRGGRITALTTTASGASVERRDAALGAAVAAAVAARGGAPPGRAAPAPTDPQGRGAPTAGPWLAAAGLALVGAIALALGTRPTAY